MGGARRRHHVERAGTDGRCGDHDLATASRLGEADGGQRHGLLVLTAPHGQPVPHRFERLREAGDVAVTEDCERAGEERDPLTVDDCVLAAEVADQGLRHRQAYGFALHRSPLPGSVVDRTRASVHRQGPFAGKTASAWPALRATLPHVMPVSGAGPARAAPTLTRYRRPPSPFGSGTRPPADTPRTGVSAGSAASRSPRARREVLRDAPHPRRWRVRPPRRAARTARRPGPSRSGPGCDARRRRRRTRAVRRRRRECRRPSRGRFPGVRGAPRAGARSDVPPTRPGRRCRHTTAPEP